MSLDEYKKKRNFGKTKEPKGQAESQDTRIYVIQRHDASHLHYDLRLEKDGVLRSWAVPKEPPIKEGIRRLAVQVEDHPMEYAEFEGTISKGEYGAGTVEIWDRGTFSPELFDEEKVIFTIIGRKLKGRYCLVRLKPKEKNWLFFKMKG
jgi:DNA ligase D-like protein (predicted 3'-phosphoesterase)